MNERILELAEQCYEKHELLGTYEFNKEKFAKLIVRDCIDTLEFHGFDEAVPYIKWMATNKFGVE